MGFESDLFERPLKQWHTALDTVLGIVHKTPPSPCAHQAHLAKRYGPERVAASVRMRSAGMFEQSARCDTAGVQLARLPTLPCAQLLTNCIHAACVLC